jgi:hypothetical protein
VNREWAGLRAGLRAGQVSAVSEVRRLQATPDAARDVTSVE